MPRMSMKNAVVRGAIGKKKKQRIAVEAVISGLRNEGRTFEADMLADLLETDLASATIEVEFFRNGGVYPQPRFARVRAKVKSIQSWAASIPRRIAAVRLREK